MKRVERVDKLLFYLVVGNRYIIGIVSARFVSVFAYLFCMAKKQTKYDIFIFGVRTVNWGSGYRRQQ